MFNQFLKSFLLIFNARVVETVYLLSVLYASSRYKYVSESTEWHQSASSPLRTRWSTGFYTRFATSFSRVSCTLSRGSLFGWRQLGSQSGRRYQRIGCNHTWTGCLLWLLLFLDALVDHTDSLVLQQSILRRGQVLSTAWTATTWLTLCSRTIEDGHSLFFVRLRLRRLCVLIVLLELPSLLIDLFWQLCDKLVLHFQVL